MPCNCKRLGGSHPKPQDTSKMVIPEKDKEPKKEEPKEETK